MDSHKAFRSKYSKSNPRRGSQACGCFHTACRVNPKYKNIVQIVRAKDEKPEKIIHLQVRAHHLSISSPKLMFFIPSDALDEFWHARKSAYKCKKNLDERGPTDGRRTQPKKEIFTSQAPGYRDTQPTHELDELPIYIVVAVKKILYATDADEFSLEEAQECLSLGFEAKEEEEEEEEAEKEAETQT